MMRYLIVAVFVLGCSLCLAEDFPKDPSEFKSLTVQQARQGVAMFDRIILRLDGLTSIDKDVAHELAKFKGGLVLNGLTSIDKDVAQELAESKAGLFLNGLTSINKDVAEELAKKKTQLLSLKSLTSIDEDVANELAKFEGKVLFLPMSIKKDKDVYQILLSNPHITYSRGSKSPAIK